MKLPLLVIAVSLVPASAAASMFSAGSVYAENCYDAARARNPSDHAMESCNRAFAEPSLVPRDRVATHVNRGVLFLIRGDGAKANADFDEALAIDPSAAEAWLNKGVAQARFGKATEALPHVEKALELGTRRPALAYFIRAMAYEDAGNIRGAYNDLKRAQALEPAWSEPTIELRRFQVRQVETSGG